MVRNLSLTVLLMAAASILLPAETKNVDKTLHLDGNGSVVIESHNGTIHVHTWDKPEIEIHARIESNGRSEEDLRRFRDTTVDINGTSGSVHITSKLPNYANSGWGWLGGNWGSNPEIHYTITAPRNANWTVRDHNSKVEMRDVNAAVRIDTHNSEVHIEGLGGALELSTHNGQAYVGFSSFTRDSSVEMHNGSVELSMPSSSKFNLHSSTHNGGVDSDFNVLTHSSSSRHMRGDLNGAVNGGGPSLKLTSHNGNFRLRAR